MLLIKVVVVVVVVIVKVVGKTTTIIIITTTTFITLAISITTYYSYSDWVCTAVMSNDVMKDLRG